MVVRFMAFQPKIENGTLMLSYVKSKTSKKIQAHGSR